MLENTLKIYALTKLDPEVSAVQVGPIGNVSIAVAGVGLTAVLETEQIRRIAAALNEAADWREANPEEARLLVAVAAGSA